MGLTTPELWKPDKATWSRMFKATHQKRTFAEKLLANMTPAELKLWAELSKQNVGTEDRPRCPWRPQVVIKGWIVDFYNDHTLTAIEVDGQVHDAARQQSRDEIKDMALRHFGICVIRIRNQEVFRNTEKLVFDRILSRSY